MRPSEQAVALFTNVFGYEPDPEALHAGECWQVERIDAALRRAKAEVWREAATHVLTCMHAVDAANDFDARAAQIEEGE